MNEISNILVMVVAIGVAISVHEFGHAGVAYLLGDDTAKREGRLTLSPIKHLDVIGLIMMIAFKIGWAKPVPVNPNNFKNYKLGNLLVSLAGVFMNIVTAVICLLLIKHVNIYAIREIAGQTMVYNIFFAAFNLLPIPPLDGWGVISTFIPYRFNEFIYKYESLSSVIFVLMIITKFHVYLINPIHAVISRIVMFFAGF